MTDASRAEQYAREMAEEEFLFDEDDVLAVSEAPISGQARVLEMLDDDPYAGGVGSGGIPPQAKVHLPDDIKKLRKRTRPEER